MLVLRGIAVLCALLMTAFGCNAFSDAAKKEDIISYVLANKNSLRKAIRSGDSERYEKQGVIRSVSE